MKLTILSWVTVSLLFVAGCNQSQVAKQSLDHLNGASDKTSSVAIALTANPWCSHFLNNGDAAYERFRFVDDGQLAIAQGDRLGEGVDASYGIPNRSISGRWGLEGSKLTFGTENAVMTRNVNVAEQNGRRIIMMTENGTSYTKFYSCP